MTKQALSQTVDFAKHDGLPIDFQTKVDMTLTKRRIPSLGNADMSKYNINESLLAQAAFEPKTYTITLDQGNFLSPYDAQFPGAQMVIPTGLLNHKGGGLSLSVLCKQAGAGDCVEEAAEEGAAEGATEGVIEGAAGKLIRDADLQAALKAGQVGGYAAAEAVLAEAGETSIIGELLEVVIEVAEV
ncbi:uncharacterized protein G6M90_00g079150 [Metarhizium brunneum]|uniref:Uncharacterized protein n=1 Tax=Metarhizium brunneum TaxID=500148 RepID=A0A7D5UYX4_9HYPO|nr:hypothetical protein G6M90_00g079150 [Metarhizium brunneum]